MSTQTEINTIASTMAEVAARISALVEHDGEDLAPDTYTELVAAERTVGALVRRLGRIAQRVA